MQFKTEEKLRAYLTKRVSNDITVRNWAFNGIMFNTWHSYFDGDFHTRVEYTCTLKQISARVARGYECKGTYEMIAEKTFDRDNAISECIAWVVDKLIEVYKVIGERIAPYTFRKDLYEQAVSRPLKLQEGKQ